MSDNAVVEYEVIRKQHLTLTQQASELASNMETDIQYNETAEFLVAIKEARRKWATMIKPVVQAAYQAHQKIKGLEKEIDVPLARAENEILKPAMVRYSDAKEAARRKEQDRINRALAEEAERKRKEAAEKAEKEKLILPSSVTPTPQLEQPVIVPTVVLEKAQEPEGISYFDTYNATVVDLRFLCQAVIDGKAPISAIKPDQVFINQRARMLKDAMRWPGVKVVISRSVRTTSRRENV